MPDVLLTGGSGFVGGALLDALVARGRRVRALARSPRARDSVRSAGAEPVSGDLTDEASLAEAASGCRIVFHVGGLNATCLRDPDALDRVNVGGTRSVLRAAAAAGVPRVVYTSSAAVIGEERGVVATEATRHSGVDVTRYARSKRHAEQVAFEEAERLGIDLVAVLPSSVQGPGRTTGTARLFTAYLQGRLRWTVETRFSAVFVDDVTAAHLLAEERGAAGERYLVSGWTTTVADALDLLGRVTGIRHRTRRIPGWLAVAGASVAGAAHRLVGKDGPVCLEVARALLHGHAFDGGRAERDLGLRYTPPDRWLAETVGWYRSQGIA